MAWTSFKSWEAVGAWYRGLESSRAVPDDEIKAKVALLIAGKATDEDKVKAVYAYVATQIRYIGVAFGVGRFQPHEAVDVLHNQYGDCKDKATLLAAMLAVAGAACGHGADRIRDSHERDRAFAGIVQPRNHAGEGGR